MLEQVAYAAGTHADKHLNELGTVDRKERHARFASDGTIYVGETPVPPGEFEESFPQLLRAADTEYVYIRGDSLANWGAAVRVIATVARTEGIRFGIVARAWPSW